MLVGFLLYMDDRLHLLLDLEENMFGKTIKVLITKGYGAGFSTWARGEVAEFILTYKPIIDYLEQSEIKDRGFREPNGLTPEHPLVKQMLGDILTKFGEQGVKNVCVLSVDNLEVEEVYIPSLLDIIKIKDHDGYESIGS